MKKTIIIAFVLFTVAITLTSGFSESSGDKVVKSIVISDSVILSSSALKKNSSFREIKSKTDLTQISEKKRLLDEIINDEEIQQINEIIKKSFLSKIKNTEDASVKEFLNFVDRYGLAKKMRESYSKIDSDDLRTILEIKNHPITKILEANETKNTAKIQELFSKNKKISIDPEKEETISYILEQTNQLEASQVLIKGIIEETIYSSLIHKDEKVSVVEARAKAVSFAESQMKKYNEKLYSAVLITYDSLSKDQLDEYLRFSQKINAHRATTKSVEATTEVMRDFLSKAIRLINLKNKKS